MDSFQLKYLCALAITLTILSLFISHKTNPWMPEIPRSLPTSDSIHTMANVVKISTQLTTPECKAADTLQYPNINRPLQSQPLSKYAYIHCIDLNLDITEQMYGILSFEGGLRRTKSKHDHIILIPQSNRPELHSINSLEHIQSFITILTQSIKHSQFKIIPFDATEIDNAFTQNPNHKQFRDTFHMAYAFKNIDTFSKYEKLVLVQFNMVILSNNLDILFNYLSPSAPPERWSGLESNIACFVYSIDSHNIYEYILEHLRNDIYVWYNDEENKNRDINDNPKKWEKDAWNSEKGTFQSLINAVYWQREYGLRGINQIHQKFAVNTNKLSNKRTKYFVEHRRNMLHMIEFVDDYPPTRKARDRCIVRTHKMIKGATMDWMEIAMNTYFVQFWLDLNRICADESNDNVCDKLKLNFQKELESSLLFHKTFGYPFPYVPL